MRSLFLEIFLSFWGTVIGTAVTLALTLRLGPTATPTRWHVAWGFALRDIGRHLLSPHTGPDRADSAVARRGPATGRGELNARAANMKPRRDEIGELVRDFNFMAGRVEELVTSQRQLISDISHELRSPLTRVNATWVLVRQRLGPDPMFDRMERDTERLNEMIGRILTVARLDMTATKAEMQRTELKALVSDIVADVQWEAGRAQLPRRSDF